MENSPASSTSVGNPSTSSGITSPSFTRSGWTFCFTYTLRARSSLDMPRTVFRPMPTPTTFGFGVGVMPSRSRPKNWHSPTTFASSGFAIHFPRSESPEGPRDDDLDRDFLEGLRESTEDLRMVLLHVDADAFLAVLLAYSDANDARHLHQPHFVTPFHIRYGGHDCPCRPQAINPPRASPRSSRDSRRRGPDEPVLHEELRLLASPADEGDRVVVELVPGFPDASDSLFDRLHSDPGGLPGKHIDLVHRRGDLFFVETLLLRDEGELLGGGDTHLVRDRPRPHIQRAAEDSGESEGIVHLVREVRAPGRDHARPSLGRLPRPNFRDRVRDHEQNGVVRHGGDPILLDDGRPRFRGGDDDVDTVHRLRDPADAAFSVRHLGELPLLREFLLGRLDILPMPPHDAFRVDQDQVRQIGRASC